MGRATRSWSASPLNGLGHFKGTAIGDRHRRLRLWPLLGIGLPYLYPRSHRPTDVDHVLTVFLPNGNGSRQSTRAVGPRPEETALRLGLQQLARGRGEHGTWPTAVFGSSKTQSTLIAWWGLATVAGGEVIAAD